MKIKIPFPEFARSPNQTPHILKNRYVFELSIEKEDYSVGVVHEALWAACPEAFRGEVWGAGYSWWLLSIQDKQSKEFFEDRKPDQTYLFGFLKKFDDYYDGPIVSWEFGPVYINYRS
jgi:hypothetical protein